MKQMQFRSCTIASYYVTRLTVAAVERRDAEDARARAVLGRGGSLGDGVEPPGVEDAAAPPLAERADVPRVSDAGRALEVGAAACGRADAACALVGDDGADGEEAAVVEDVPGRAERDGGAAGEVHRRRSGRGREGCEGLVGLTERAVVGGVVKPGEVLPEGLLCEVGTERVFAGVGQVGW